MDLRQRSNEDEQAYSKRMRRFLTKKDSKTSAKANDFKLLPELLAEHQIRSSAIDRAWSSSILKNRYGSLMDKSNIICFGRELLKHESRGRARKANLRYLEEIVCAYALFHWIMSRPGPEWYFIQLCEAIGVRPRANFNPIAVVLRAVIDYEPEQEPEDAEFQLPKYAERKLWHRDAKAIQWLIDHGIPPRQVLAFQKKHGGGVVSWSKAKGPVPANKEQKDKLSQCATEPNTESSNDARLPVHTPSSHEGRLEIAAALAVLAKHLFLKSGEGAVIMLRAGEGDEPAATLIGSQTMMGSSSLDSDLNMILKIAGRISRRGTASRQAPL